METRQPRVTPGIRQRGLAVAAALATAGALTSGCVLDRLDRATGDSTSSERTATISLNGTWTGTYTCNQGSTRLRLTLTQVPGSTSVRGTFFFTADPSNPGVPAGSYSMTGSLIDGSLRLQGDRWLVRPSGYEMVGLNAQISNTNQLQIEGEVDNPDCTGFSVNRA